MLVTDTAGHYTRELQTHSSGGTEIINRLLDAIVAKETLHGDLHSLELAIEQIVSSGLTDELRAARTQLHLKRMRRDNGASLTQMAEQKHRCRDMCGND